jgi:outer membrane protein assembly factor BamB
LIAPWCLGLVALVPAAPATLAQHDWTQWGGPHRNFQSSATGLSDQWPEDGPPVIWKRELGPGYSSILVEGDRIYTMYRKGEQECTVAMEADGGETVWEYCCDAPFIAGKMSMEFGPGPHSTPLIVGDRMFTVGVTDKLHCLDKKTGKVLWKHDLAGEFDATILDRGYSASPIAYGDNVIVTVGGEGKSVMAFRQNDGSVAWKAQDFENSHCSPILIKFGGRDHLVVFMTQQIAGLDPTSGDLLWEHPHETQFGANISTPAWSGDGLIFMSSAYNGGSRMVRLIEDGGAFRTEEVWYNRRMQIHHGNVLRIGDVIYGSSGSFGPAFLIALDAQSGKRLWRERGFAKSTLLAADGKVILLDEDGQLALTRMSPEGLEVLSKVKLLERTSWTVPTLSDTTLYIRDKNVIMALNVGV